MNKQVELIDILLKSNALTTDQADEIKRESEAGEKKIEDIIIDHKYAGQEEVTKAKAQIFGLPYVDLMEQEISEEAINTISADVAENYHVVCFDRQGSRIRVGLTDPGNFKAIEAVDFLAKGNGWQVEYFLISPKSYKKAFKNYKSLAKELHSALESKQNEDKGEKDGKSVKLDEETDEYTKSAPVAKMVSVIIRHAVDGDASDIHIEPVGKETRVRYRIDGVLHTSLVLPISVHNALVARVKVMANLKLDETRIPQDGRIRLKVNERDIDFRVSILPLLNTEKVVMRILDTTKGAPKLEELGFEGIQSQIVKRNIKQTEGLLLVTGPTGSGKSTTLFSILEMINKEGVNISTLEDPIEYQIKGVNQSQIRPEIGYSFATGLRSFLRQDPDVIMVGEIRDQETAELAIHAALTGHSVLSTLHTNSALGAIDRLIDMEVEPFLLGSTLHTVIAQRLSRKICNDCKTEMKMPEEYLEDINKEIDAISEKYINEVMPGFDRKKMTFYHGKGCSHCGNTGYTGRLAILEVLDVNDQLKEMISDRRRSLSIAEVRKQQDYITMKQDGIIKVLQGLTTMEEVLRVIKN